MSRYIDADKLRAQMYHEAFEVDSDMQRWDSGCWIRYKMFENAIDAQPTADVRENVRGRWILHGEPPWYVRECSVCGEKWHHWSGYNLKDCNFCEKCGAKME